MKPLIVLLSVFIVALGATRLTGDDWNFIFAGNVAMSAMLIFTSIGHFVYAKGMSRMLPAVVPFKKEIVHLTGLLEIAAAIGLLWPAIREVTAIVLIIFFVFVLPANIYGAIHKVDYQRPDREGKGVGYLWMRVPLQVFFIAWVAYFGIYA